MIFEEGLAKEAVEMEVAVGGCIWVGERLGKKKKASRAASGTEVVAVARSENRQTAYSVALGRGCCAIGSLACQVSCRVNVVEEPAVRSDAIPEALRWIRETERRCCARFEGGIYILPLAWQGPA